MHEDETSRTYTMCHTCAVQMQAHHVQMRKAIDRCAASLNIKAKLCVQTCMQQAGMGADKGAVEAYTAMVETRCKQERVCNHTGKCVGWITRYNGAGSILLICNASNWLAAG